MAFVATPQEHTIRSGSVLNMLKSFAIWAFTLLVCYLIVGFPLFFLVILVGSLLATTLQPILPVSSVLVVAGSFTFVHVAAILGGAAMLTLRGIEPQTVSWLSWSNTRAALQYSIAYPSCPLTCPILFEDR
jgi:uncharacterized membrane protein